MTTGTGQRCKSYKHERESKEKDVGYCSNVALSHGGSTVSSLMIQYDSMRGDQDPIIAAVECVRPSSVGIEPSS